MTARDFLAFAETRADEERWELLEGVPQMNAAPSLLHQIILGNLYFLLRQAEVETSGLWSPVLGFGLRVSEVSVPVPDLLVRPNKVFAGRDCDDAFVAFEILSPSTAHSDRRVKRTLYANLPSLQHYVIVAQDEAIVLSYARQDGWTERKIDGFEARLDIPALDLALPLADIYQGTGLS